MLFVGGLEATVATVGRHGRLGISRADLLELARLAATTFSLLNVGLHDCVDMPNGQRIPADMRPDQRCIEMDDLTGFDLSCNTGLHRPLEDPSEALSAPPLANARQ